MVKGSSEQSQMVARLLMVLFGLVFFAPPAFYFLKAVNSFAAPAEAFGQRRRMRSKPSTPQKPKVDYKNFSHKTHVSGQKLECSSCHAFPTKNWKEVRKGDAAFADVAEFPEHSTCLDCHRREFFARERPAPSICSNCHVNVTPRDSTRFLFPSLGDVADSTRPRLDRASEFLVHFPHEVHLEVVSAAVRAPKDSLVKFVRTSLMPALAPAANCSLCHQTHSPQGNSSEEYVTKPPKNLDDTFWLKKGTFKTIPNSHTLCFTCHNADSGIAPTSADCQVCHKLPGAAALPPDFDPSLISTMGIKDSVMVKAWGQRISAGAFRHEGGAHPDIACTDCHRPAVMNTAQPVTLRVPVRSCGGEGCHITPTTDDGGSLNYEMDQKKVDAKFVCTKCHITFGKQAVPPGHLQALPTAAPAKKPGVMGL
jgi:Cytochrome c7 and related cytochrome c